jgi:hypothetical protein
MTVEIAILNKEAVALASDSAVTVRLPGGQKIFTSANKLFPLSNYTLNHNLLVYHYWSMPLSVV